MTAYLVIREGSKWTDVFRLVDGESVTIGRPPTNAIVVKDERCSRNHAEVFQSQSQWTLRDLDSRVGTTSITIDVSAWKRTEARAERAKVTEGVFTYVRIDENRRPAPLAPQLG
jgi:hypothetical protein